MINQPTPVNSTTHSANQSFKTLNAAKAVSVVFQTLSRLKCGEVSRLQQVNQNLNSTLWHTGRAPVLVNNPYQESEQHRQSLHRTKIVQHAGLLQPSEFGINVLHAQDWAGCWNAFTKLLSANYLGAVLKLQTGWDSAISDLKHSFSGSSERGVTATCPCP